jgi:HlyD family secretion protein
VQQVRLAASNVSNVITYPVVIAVDNADLALLPGMTANAEIEISARRDVLRLPNAALRFAPATVARSRGAVEQTQRGPSAGGASPRGAWADDLSARLQLSDAQQARLQELLAAGRGGGRAGMPGGERPDPALIERMMRERMNTVLDAFAAELSVEQQAALADWQAQQAQTRMVTVHVPDGGQAQPRRVRIGIGDAQYTELVDGPLGEGDPVVVGYAAPAR